MNRLFIYLLFVPSLGIFANENTNEKEGFEYSSLGIDIIQTDSTSVGARLAIPLPGNLYILAERKAEEVDFSEDSYERVISAVRIGVHSGIGDIISSISASGLRLNIKNIFDVYAELGVKTTSYDTKIDLFSEDDSQANVITGIRFGDPFGWEGKFYIDFSKDAEISIKECPAGQVCIEQLQYELDDETDRKFGAGILYNINNRSAFSIEMSSSRIFDTSLKVGYQLNF